MVLKRLKSNLFLLMILLITTSCAKNDFKPDFSSPESAFKTFDFASSNKLPGLYLDCLSDEIKKMNGSTRKEQLSKIKESFRRNDIFRNSKIEILEICYEDGDPTLARIKFNRSKNGKTILRNGSAYMVKEYGTWKLSVNRSKQPR